MPLPKSSSDSLQSSFILFDNEVSVTGLNNNNNILDNSSVHDTLGLNDNSAAVCIYKINC